ncbi:MAG: hypothetical protein N2260_03625 [Syntrophobacterales bacterium]|nr:hypothetical protein [Syntrophobacterales bacterium]
MAEIKSTIELVMERTKHLIMSSEEKAQQEAKELIEKIPGYIQKFLDGSIKEEAVTAAYREIPEGYKREARKKLIESVLERVDLESPKSLFVLLQNLLGEKDFLLFQVAELRDILATYHEKAEKLKEEIKQKISTQLTEKNISGDAILLIPEETPAYYNLTRDYEKRLHDLKQRITKNL